MPGSLKLLTESGGSLTIAPTDTGSSYTMSLPSSSDTITTNTATQILSNKTLDTPTISSSSGEIARVQGGTSSAGFVRFADNTNTNIGYIGRNNTSDIYLWQSTANSIVFGTNNLQCGKFDSSGRFTIPNQPAFSASMTSGGTSGTGDIVFNTVYVNTNSCYNNSNGRFTAPVAGNYYFSAYVLSMNAGFILFNFLKNGSSSLMSGYVQFYGSGTNYVTPCASIIATLSAGDYVTVRPHSSYYSYYTSGYNNFSGYLIG